MDYNRTGDSDPSKKVDSCEWGRTDLRVRPLADHMQEPAH